MLIRVIYVSSAVGPQTSTVTSAILKKATAWNKANDITGVLCQGQGVYLQALEGERSIVTKLYSRIYADPRHTNIEMIHCESIAKRRYANWSMAHGVGIKFGPIGLWRMSACRTLTRQPKSIGPNLIPTPSPGCW